MELISEFLSRAYNTTRRSIFSVHLTGGAVTGVMWLFTTPGASRSIETVCVPYSHSALASFLKNAYTSGSCSASTAILMSQESYSTTLKLYLQTSRDFCSLGSVNLFGIGCTAALVTNTPKKGDHRCHISVCDSTGIRTYNLNLIKGRRNRMQEDHVCARLILDALAEQCKLSKITGDYLIDNEVVEELHEPCGDNLNALLNNQIQSVTYVEAMTTTDASLPQYTGEFAEYVNVTMPPATLIIPGSFNPLHAGHLQLVLAVLKQRHHWTPTSYTPQPPVVFEISAVNVDKPSLTAQQLQQRVKQFRHCSSSLLTSAGLVNYAVCVTAHPRFLDKSALFPSCEFVIGVDTMTRLMHPKYYAAAPPLVNSSSSPTSALNNVSVGDRCSDSGSDLAALMSMAGALAVMSDRLCRFIVGGRVDANTGAFHTLTTEESDQNSPFGKHYKCLPQIVKDMFVGLTEEDFRVDLSSTQIRNEQLQKQV